MIQLSTTLERDSALGQDSLYAATTHAPQLLPPVTGTVQFDVAIVGGGLTGLSAAIELAQQGLSVCLLEARTFGSGASGRNGGQVIHGYAADMAVMESQLGAEQARQVFDMSLEALALLKKRITQFSLNCDWRDGHLSVATSNGKAKQLIRDAETMEHRYGYKQRVIERTDLPNWLDSRRYFAGVHDPLSGHINPLKFTYGLARAAQLLGVALYETSPVLEILGGKCATLRTPQGSISARQVLLAGNVTLEGLVPWMDARIMPVASYIAATEPLEKSQAHALIPCGAAVSDNNVVLDYFRVTADQRLLYGGRVGFSQQVPKNLRRILHRRMVATFPSMANVSVDYCWGGYVDMTMNRAPDFGRLPGHANVFYLQGFCGHGIALSGLAGRVAAEAMLGDLQRFDVFARINHKRFPGGKLLRSPALVLGMTWYRLRDALT